MPPDPPDVEDGDDETESPEPPLPEPPGGGEEVGKDFGPFDLICHVAFDKPPLTRRERAENVRKRNYFTKYGDQAMSVLNALLDKYADAGIRNIEDLKVLRVQPIDRFGTPIEIITSFGGRKKYEEALRELERHL